MALKIDLEKAYDKIEWNFIENALNICNFPPKLVEWIMTCIRSVSFEINVNGKLSQKWIPQRGIRQGDPLSPYLFIICMNFLILKFVKGHEEKQFDGMQINKHTPPIPILCFADDCIIFCKNNNKSIDFIQNTLNVFAEEAGLHINWSKTKAFFSKNTSNSKIKETCKKLNIKVGNKEEKYLGLPLIIQRITKESFYDIVNKTQARICNWYNKFLSYAGRTTLINHVLTTMPNYTMSTHKIPNITLQKISNLTKKFLWNASKDANRKSPISWNTVCTPKSYGGLGIRNIKLLNQAFILKMAWRLRSDEESLWGKTLKGKYFPHQSFDNAPTPKPYNSTYWKNIYRTIDMLEDATFWIIGNGENINFWKAKWLGNFKIEDYVKDIPDRLKNMKVNNIIDWNRRSWNLEDNSNICPRFIIECIQATHIPEYDKKDEYRWAFNKQGRFTLKSAYSWLLQQNGQINNPKLPWDYVWNLRVHARIKFFMWQLMHNILPNYYSLKKKENN